MKYLPLLIILAGCCQCPEPYQQPGWKGWRGESEDYWRGMADGAKLGADAVEEVYVGRRHTNTVESITPTNSFQSNVVIYINTPVVFPLPRTNE